MTALPPRLTPKSYAQELMDRANAVALLRCQIQDVVLGLVRLPDAGRLAPDVSAAIVVLETLQRRFMDDETELCRAMESDRWDSEQGGES